MYAEKIKKLGFDVDEAKIFTGEATTIYLKKTKFRRIYLVGTPALEEEFSSAGFQLTDQFRTPLCLGSTRH